MMASCSSVSQDDDLDITLGRSRIKYPGTRRRANLPTNEEEDTVDDSPTRRTRRNMLRPRCKIKEKQRSKKKVRTQVQQTSVDTDGDNPQTPVLDRHYGHLHATRSTSDMEADLEDNRDYDDTDKQTNGQSDSESEEENARLKQMLADEMAARRTERERLSREIIRKDEELRSLREELKKLRLKTKD